MVFDLIARDRASVTFDRVGASAEMSGKKAETAGRSMRHFAEAIGAIALVEAGKKSLEMAGDFQQSTNVLVTAAGETQRNLGAVRKGIMDIAVGTGTPLKELTDGMYQIEKAGYRGSAGLKILKTSSQGAREEGANLATVTSAMTSIMASYHIPVSKNVSVMNQLKTAAGESKTTMEQFAGSLSTVLPVASANHISFAKVAGALATLTQHGTSADEATQELSNTIRNLSAPNMVAVREMSQLGINAQDVSQKLGRRGIAGTVNYLSQTVLQKMGPAGKVLLDTFMKSQAAGADAKAMMDKMSPSMRNLARRFIEGKIIQQDWGKALQGFTPVQAAQMSQFATMERRAKGFNQAIRNGLPGSQTYTEAIKKMTGGANGLNTTLQLTGESTAGTAERIKRIQDAARGAGKNVSGWASTQKLFNVQLDMFKERVQVIGVRLGTALIPRVLFAAKAFGGLLDFVQQNSAWLKPLAITLGSLAATVFLVGKATAAWAAITKVVTVATKVWAAGQWLLNVALDANPIGIMIVAIAALAAGIIYAYKHSETFRKIINAIGQWFVTAGKDVIKWGKDFGHWVADGFHKAVTAATDMYRGVIGWFQKVWKGIVGIGQSIADYVRRHWRLLLTIATAGVGFIFVLIVNHWKAISGVFAAGWHAVAGFAQRLWSDVSGWFKRLARDVWNVISPFWNAEVRGWKNIWAVVSGFAKRIWGDVSGWFRKLGRDVAGIVSALWSDEVRGWKNIWNSITGWATRIWKDVRSTFNTLKGDIGAIIGRSGMVLVFQNAVGTIGRVWKGLQSLAKAPISFIINTVLNKGLIPAWNWVAGELHESKVKPIHLAGFRDGGPTGVGGDSQIAGFAHANEHYATADEVRRTPGGHATWERMRGLIRSGITDWLPGYQSGGLVKPIRAAVTQYLHDQWTGFPAIDFGAPVGTPVVAGARGRVILSRDLLGGGVGGYRSYGRYIEIASQGFKTLYAHLSQRLAQVGQMVRAGQEIGLSGATGNTRGAHLHFGAQGISPLDFLGVGYRNTGKVPGGGGGGLFDFLGLLGGKVRGALSGLSRLGGSPWVHLISAFPRMVGGWLLDKAKAGITSLFGTADPSRGFGTKGSNRQRGHSLMLQYGWPAAQWPALDRLWTRESGWNERAQNPSSGAYGIPQALPGSKMSSVGVDWRVNPNTQIMWGLQYIKQRYGSPSGAWSHEMSAGWYDRGGLAVGRGWMPKNTIRPERVLPPHETQVYDQLLDLLKTQGLGARGPLVNVEKVDATVDLHAFARQADFLERQGHF
jgi:phage-related protein